MNPWPSWKSTAGKRARSSTSRGKVQVVLRTSRSIVRACRAGNRAEALSGTNLTFSGSPRAAAATARQKSASNPCQRPAASFSENPAMPSLTPQRR